MINKRNFYSFSYTLKTLLPVISLLSIFQFLLTNDSEWRSMLSLITLLFSLITYIILCVLNLSNSPDSREIARKYGEATGTDLFGDEYINTIEKVIIPIYLLVAGLQDRISKIGVLVLIGCLIYRKLEKLHKSEIELISDESETESNKCKILNKFKVALVSCHNWMLPHAQCIFKHLFNKWISRLLIVIEIGCSIYVIYSIFFKNVQSVYTGLILVGIILAYILLYKTHSIVVKQAIPKKKGKYDKLIKELQKNNNYIKTNFSEIDTSKLDETYLYLILSDVDEDDLRDAFKNIEKIKEADPKVS